MKKGKRTQAIALGSIEAYLRKEKISYHMDEEEQCIVVPACAFDDDTHSNFYDYGESYKKPRCYTKDKFMAQIFTDPHVIVMDCGECCGCAGW